MKKINIKDQFLHDKEMLRSLQGRHPVVEKFTTFIKNDVVMDEGEIFLITGTKHEW